ncbi:MAG TPA: Fic family protein [Pyrinomonadaceae bacterium]|jgi:Fic family protein
MKSFQNKFLENMPITQNILRSVRLLGEYKGKQDLFVRQIPQALETLKQAAIIQSIESSNRIEGVTAPAKRIKEIAAEKTTPQNRSEQEIAGYRDVLQTIHGSFADIPFNNNVILQLHRDLFKYSDAPGGRWKEVDNDILEKRPDGTEFIRFKPISAFGTPAAMDELTEIFNREWRAGEIEKLILIPAYVLDFLSVHPFRDGNGRMARLLSLLLLYKAGYDVGRYISLEKLVEDSKESYYETLYKSSQEWHEGRHNLLPWTEYFLGTVTAAYREFEKRVGRLNTARGAKTQMIFDALSGLPETFRISDLEKAAPQVSREMIRKVFAGLKKDGKLVSEGFGPNATWRKIGDF